ncbi:unnamed protein product [Heterobilharzia americana]|nr:unnamed protein product [Heterobilharzia americana]
MPSIKAENKGTTLQDIKSKETRLYEMPIRPLASNKAHKLRLKQKHDGSKQEIITSSGFNEKKSYLQSTPDLRGGSDNLSNENLLKNNSHSKKPHRLLSSAVSKINLRRSRSKSDKGQRSYSNPRPEISAPILATGQKSTTIQHDFNSLNLINNNDVHKASRPTPPPPPPIPVQEIKLDNSQTVSVSGNDELGIWIEKPIKPIKPEDKTILNRLMECDRKSSNTCSICHKPMSLNERYDLVDQVIHRNCFKCSICNETLTDKSAIFQNGSWCCAIHFRYNLDNIDIQLKGTALQRTD